jgi:hypothetical protein
MDGGCKWKGDVVDLLVTAATKAAGQEGTARISDCNKLWSVCVADPTGPVSRDAAEESAGATPR